MLIDSKIWENIINEDEDWKQDRDDSFSIPLKTCKGKEIRKTKLMNGNIVKHKVKFTMECRDNEEGC